MSAADAIWTPEMDAAIADGLASGRLYKDIAKDLGLSRAACIGRGYRLGLRCEDVVERVRRSAKSRRRFDHGRAAAMRANGAMLKEIAKELGVTAPAVCQALKKFNRAGAA